MSDSENSDTAEYNNYKEIQEEIEKCKRNPETSGMFVSGWDDADQDVEVVKNPRESPFDHILWAAESGNVDLLKELIKIEPGLVHVRDSDGYTPLHRASYSNHLDTVQFLLSVGAKVNATTELGWTPLHSASNWNNYKIVARLLAAGADPTALSQGAQTPLHLAAALSHSKSTLLILLLRKDLVAIAKKRNNRDETPVDLARGHGIYAPLFEMVCPAISYIHSLAFTCNPFVRRNESVLLENKN